MRSSSTVSCTDLPFSVKETFRRIVISPLGALVVSICLPIAPVVAPAAVTIGSLKGDGGSYGPSLSSRTTPGIGMVVPMRRSRRFYLQQALFVQMRQAYQGCLLERLAIVFRRAGVTVLIKNLFDCIFATAESDKLGRLLRQLNDLNRLAGARYCRYPAASIFRLGHL